VTNLQPEQEDLLQSQDAEVLASTIRQDLQSTAQIAKVDNEADLLVKKALTEEEQLVVLTFQEALYDAQKLGFKNDYNAKIFKIRTDAVNTMYATDFLQTSADAQPDEDKVKTFMEDVLEDGLPWDT